MMAADGHGTALTTCESAALTEARLVGGASPLYWAVMLCVPCARLSVVHVACRAASTGCALQPEIPAAPSMKATVPVGLVSLTVAVNVTLAPTVDGLSELTTVVVEGSGVPALITCDRGALADGRLPASPA